MSDIPEVPMRPATEEEKAAAAAHLEHRDEVRKAAVAQLDRLKADVQLNQDLLRGALHLALTSGKAVPHAYDEAVDACLGLIIALRTARAQQRIVNAL